MLPTDYKARKALPLYTYLTQYHPDALMELVKVAVAGNQQHNPGEPLHWAQGKSMDQLNTAVRHIFDHGQGNVYDTADDEYLKAAGVEGHTMHLAKAAWRLLAEIQLLCDARAAGAPIEKMVRGTHEFMESDLREPEPTPEVEKDYPRMGQPAVFSQGWVPLGSGPLGEDSQLPTPTIAIPMPPVKTPADQHAKRWPDDAGAGAAHKGRLMPCGCFGSCAGATPNCPNWIAKTF